MQNSSEFQYIAIDTIHESTTNPRRTFDEGKLGELAESIRTNGLIQPITVRPNNTGFEIVAGARRFRAAQLAEVFSLPARIVTIDDAQALEWQLVENSQRVDVHPYEEAQGFQRLLDMPGYDVATLVEKSGKSPAHVYARLSLLQLIPTIAEAFSTELITASHANLLARLPQEHQANAYEQCWRKDWQDKEPHLLPAKHLSAWIQSNLYLSLADAPFDTEDTTLNPPAGACVTCPRRSGFNSSLFADVHGDQCLDAPCFHIKVNAHIDRELAARPQLVQIEDGWRSPKEKRPGAVQRGHFREIEQTDNPDAEPAPVCAAAKPAIVVYGKRVGTTLAVCTDNNCPVQTHAKPRGLPNESRRTPPLSWLPHPKKRRKRRRLNARPTTSSAERIAAQLLARRFHADSSAADWRRFGRLPGFTNRKPQHMLHDGLFPFVRLHSHRGKQFAAAELFDTDAEQQQQTIRQGRQTFRPWLGRSAPLSLSRFRTTARYAGRPAAGPPRIWRSLSRHLQTAGRRARSRTLSLRSTSPAIQARPAEPPIRRTVSKAMLWARA